MNANNTKLKAVLSELHRVYKQYRLAKGYIDSNLDFAVECKVKDIYNEYKHLPKEVMIKSIQGEIKEYKDAFSVM